MSWAIWITGLPGCGKSTVARAAAARLARGGRSGRAPRARSDAHGGHAAPDVLRGRTRDRLSLAGVRGGLADRGRRTGHRRRHRPSPGLARPGPRHRSSASPRCRSTARWRLLEPARARARAAPRPAPSTPAPGDGRHRAGSQRTLRARSVARAHRRHRRRGRRRGWRSGSRRWDCRWDRAERRPEAAGGAVLWLTGPPGSGKTTLASRLAERLAVRRRGGIDSRVGGAARPRSHRTLVRRARRGDRAPRPRLHGQASRRRRPRGRGRRHGATPGVARAGPGDRRHLRRGPARVPLRGLSRPRAGGALAPEPRRRTTAAPDLAIEYEYSLNPDLLLDTETRSEWTAAEDLVSFAHRLLTRVANPIGGPPCVCATS